jgi:hypothetical protein
MATAAHSATAETTRHATETAAAPTAAAARQRDRRSHQNRN